MAIYRNSSPDPVLNHGMLYGRVDGIEKPVVQLYCWSAKEAIPILRQPRDGSIAMLFNADYQNDEAENVRASLNRLGKSNLLVFSEISASGLASNLANRNILLIPEAENADLFSALGADGQQQLRSFVSRGGHLLTFYNTVTTLKLLNAFGLNAATATAVKSDGDTEVTYKRAESIAAPFQASRLPASLKERNATAVLTIGSPGAADHSQPLYVNGGNMAVASFVFGLGRVSYLGWDWFDTANTDWDAVLQELLNV